MNRIGDPYTPEDSLFECLSCGSRTTTDSHLGACPDCGGAVKNIAVAQE